MLSEISVTLLSDELPLSEKLSCLTEILVVTTTFSLSGNCLRHMQ